MPKFSLSKRRFVIYSVVTFIAFLFSLMLWVFVHCELNTKKLDLFDSDGVTFSMPGHNYEYKRIDVQPHSVSTVCDASRHSTVYMCGISFNFAPYRTFELDDYLILKAKVTSTNPHYDGRMRVTIRSLYAAASDQNRHEQFKYQSIRLAKQERPVLVLSHFNVDNWWIDQFKVPYKDSNLDYKQVANISVLVNDIPIFYSGTYKIEVSELTLVGHIIPIDKATSFLLIFWSGFVFLFLLHQAYILRKDCIDTKDQLYIDHHTGFFNLRALIKRYTLCRNVTDNQSVYFVKIANYGHLEKAIGEKAANQLLVGQWDAFQLRQKGVETEIFRVSQDEFLFKIFSEKLEASEIEVILNHSQIGADIVDEGLFSLDMWLIYIPNKYLPDSVQLLLRKSRLCYEDGKKRNQRYIEFSITQMNELDEELRIENSVHQALENNEFYLTFMPFYSTKSKSIIGAETLLRCSSEHLSKMSPEVYIKVAEKCGLVKQIDLFVVERAFATLVEHHLNHGDFLLSINLSSRQLLDNSFILELKKLIAMYSIKASQICFEITETFFVDIKDIQVKNIEQLRKLGCSVSLDDFGTGYTSYSLLRAIPADEIKIDREYVNFIGDKQNDVVIRSIIDIGKAFDYRIIAEGVETKEQLDSLIEMGCEMFQGYYFSKPTSFDDVLQLKHNVREV